MTRTLWTPADILGLFDEIVVGIRHALDDLDDWSHLGSEGAHGGQYRHDVVADGVVGEVLAAAGLGVLSEESGMRRVPSGPGAGIVVVVDPIDGSTNASRGVPWYATSLCAVDAEGPWVATVANQATGTCYRAVRGEVATKDGLAITASKVADWSDAFVLVSGWPTEHLGWQQYRALGASALDLCAVADGTADAFLDCSPEGRHGVWDYLGAALVCAQAGASVVDAYGRELLTLDGAGARTPVAANTSLLAQALGARQRLP